VLKSFFYIAVVAGSATLILAQVPVASAYETQAPDLSYLSVQTEISNPQPSAADFENPSQAPKQKGGTFSDSQAELMRTLARTIDVSSTSVRLCLRIRLN
jgi:hypothetical protein